MVKADLDFRKLLELDAGPAFHKSSEVSYWSERCLTCIWPERTKQEDTYLKDK